MTPDCHPDRAYCAGGLCRKCYSVLYSRGMRPPTYEALIHEDTEAPSCDACATDKGKLVTFQLRKSVMIGGHKTTYSGGVIILCQRCWKRCKARGRGTRRTLLGNAAALVAA